MTHVLICTDLRKFELTMFYLHDLSQQQINFEMIIIVSNIDVLNNYVLSSISFS